MSDNLVDLATTDLTSDRVHRARRRGTTVTRRAPDDLADAARGHAQRHGVTCSALWQAALLTVLHRYTGETDLAIRSGGAVWRADLSGNPGFAELTARCHTSAGTDARFQAGLAGRDAAAGSPFDLALTVGSTDLTLECPADQSDEGRAGRLLDHLTAALAGGLADPHRPVAAIDILPTAERNLVLHGWNPPPVARTPGLLHHVTLGHQPDRVAIRFAGVELTYDQLERRSNRLAHALHGHGIGPGHIVGLLLDRGIHLPIAQLAVMKAGAAWLPLDPQHPPARLALLATDAGTRLVMTTTDLAPAAPTDIPHWNLDDRDDSGPDTPPEIDVRPDDPAYLLYTSGSTGTPKGVLVPHHSAYSFCETAVQLFRTTPADRVAQTSNPAFDASICDCYATLLAGATMISAPRETIADAAAFTTLIRAEQVTLSFISTAVLALLEPDDFAGTALRAVWSAGEALPPEQASRWSRPGLELHNCYGPTETTVVVTDYLCTDEPLTGPTPIGTALPNHRAYALDEHLRPTPIGVPGQLFVAGTGVTYGYYGRPGLTAERFLADPHADQPGQRMYATGDLVRWLPGGILEFLGRRDRQVQIRGQRVELGEIEHTLSRHPHVRQCAVLLHDATHLVAYLTGEPDLDDVRRYLADRLPTYMIPTVLVTVPELPLAPNGKLDPTRLPEPTTPPATGYVAPRTDTERWLAAVWQEVIGAEEVGATDSFFDLGGDSLHAIQLVARIRDHRNVDLQPRHLFAHPVLDQFAALLDEAAPLAVDEPITPVPRTGPLPCTRQQEGLWFQHQFDPSSATYHIGLRLWVRGELDVAALGRAVHALVVRHEALRTRFVDKVGVPAQVVDDPRPMAPLPVVDIEPAAVEAWVAREIRRPLDLAAGHLFRCPLARIAADEHVLLIVVHHIVADGWSARILGAELSRLYAVEAGAADEALPALVLQPADHAVWQRDKQRRAELERQVAYWRDTLADLPTVDFPTDRPRPAQRTGAGVTVSRRLPDDLATAARAYGRTHRVSFLAVHQAALLTVLHRHTGQHDLPIGSIFSGRTRPEIEPLVGFFANPLVLRTDLTGRPTFADLVRRCHDTVLDAGAHQDAPFALVVESLRPEVTGQTNPLFQISLSLQPPGTSLPGLALAGATAEALDVSTGYARFDVALAVIDLADGGLELQVEYSTELFDADRIDRLVEQFTTALARGLAEPDRPTDEIDVLPPAERDRVLRDWSSRAALLPRVGGAAGTTVVTDAPGGRVYVLDAALRPAPIGVPGQLYVAGTGAAQGDPDRPALTACRFLADPYADRPGKRMYDTGDIARWRSDGVLEHLGRGDRQDEGTARQDEGRDPQDGHGAGQPRPPIVDAAVAPPPPAPRGELDAEIAELERRLAERALLERLLEEKRAARARRDAARRVVPVPRDGSLVCTYQQEAMWFEHQLDPDSPVNHIAFALRLRGALDVAALGRALHALTVRHESLRTRFVAEDGTPRQVIDRPADALPLPVAELDAEAVDEWAAAEISRPMDLAAGRLLRTALARLSPDEHVLVLVVHHIIADGWSATLLSDELTRLYGAGTSGAQVRLPELAVQPADYAVWQRARLDGGERERQLDFWRETLADLATIDLPTDRPRPLNPTGSGADRWRQVPDGLAQAAREYARARRVSLLTLTQATLLTVLHRYTGQTDLPIGSIFSGRTRADTEPMVGYFVNAVVLRTRLDGDPSFDGLVGRCHETVLAATAHQDVPFGLVVDALHPERVPGRNPLFQVNLSLQPPAAAQGDLTLGTVTAEPMPVSGGHARFDLAMAVIDSPDGRIELGVEYATDLFDADRINRLLDHFLTALANGLDRPEQPAREVEIMPAAERHRVLHTWNDTTAGYDAEPLHHLVERVAEHTPNAIAVIDHDGTHHTYRDLDTTANRLAHRLHHHGITPGDHVGVCLPRGIHLVTTLLAIWKTAAAYVPLDPELPPERLTAMLHDATPPVVITTGTHTEAFPTTLTLDVTDTFDAEPDTAPDTGSTLDDTAYLLYTSGSTGTPKGVAVPHRGLHNRIAWMQNTYRLEPADRVLQKTPYGFDVSVWEFFWPLTTGATLVLAAPGGHRDPDYLHQLIVDEGVTALHFVPTMLQTFLDATADRGPLGHVRHVFCSGEALPPDTAHRFLTTWPHIELHNLYGPTEASIDVTAWQCQPNSTTVPIGAPIANTRAYVLDNRLRPTPIGIAGELHIAGTGLAHGYHNRPGLTAERFRTDPYGPPGQRMYATGDLARWRSDGTLEYLGRTDRQIKLHGQRVELGDIEHALCQHAAVDRSAVAVRHGVLIGYIVGDADPADVRRFLADRLPTYMVPTTVVALPDLPVTPHGKLDTARLPEPAPPPEAGHVEPRTDTERWLAEVWENLLRVERVGAGDNFFDLGANSLHTTQLAARVRDGLGLDVHLRHVFANPVLEDFARHLDESAKAPAEANGPLVGLQPRGSQSPLFLVHPVGGAVTHYLTLATMLGDDQPVYAIEDPELHGTAPAGSLAERAGRYLDLVRGVQPHGPYHLGGWSLGGPVAMEMAGQLRDAGEEVGVVLALDSALPVPGQNPTDLETLTWFVLDTAGTAGVPLPDVDLDALRGLDRQALDTVALDVLAQAGLAPPDTHDDLRTRMRAFATNIAHYAAYRPRNYLGRLVLVTAQDNRATDDVSAWQAHAPRLEHLTVPGDHFTMLRPPHVRDLAAVVRRVLEQGPEPAAPGSCDGTPPAPGS
ncbi:amino acid adenylation domain-containing protein [Micromonospora profundi]|uniref:amino acid adenylation domain-containing protein n=1 Tax=Micromonospora profundi TaxID=1420889 RepID=UPI002FF3326D